jgi:hypothetical protein
LKTRVAIFFTEGACHGTETQCSFDLIVRRAVGVREQQPRWPLALGAAVVGGSQRVHTSLAPPHTGTRAHMGPHAVAHGLVTSRAVREREGALLVQVRLCQHAQLPTPNDHDCMSRSGGCGLVAAARLVDDNGGGPRRHLSARHDLKNGRTNEK